MHFFQQDGSTVADVACISGHNTIYKELRKRGAKRSVSQQSQREEPDSGDFMEEFLERLDQEITIFPSMLDDETRMCLLGGGRIKRVQDTTDHLA